MKKILTGFLMVFCIIGSITAQTRGSEQRGQYMQGSGQDLTGIYEIELANGMVADLRGISSNNGIAVVQNSRNGAQTQRWRFERLSTGRYIIINMHSGKAMDVEGGVNQRNNGAKIHQWDVHRGASQQWHIFAGGDGWFGIQNENSKRVLDMSASNFNVVGHQFHQWEETNNTQNKRFRLLRVGEVTSVGPDYSGTYEIHLTNGFVVDLRGISSNNGIAVIQNTRNGGATQRWRFERLSQTDNIYIIINASTGKAIDVNERSRDNGGRLHQWDTHRAASQQWRVTDAGSGFVRLQNVHSGKMMDMSASNFNNAGHQFHQWENNNGQNQQFRLVR
ncbi:MAG: RICIN domain-containing protein [Treponema sp.]|nr:RICIN domain-containing protein [Treponema sp.]